MGRRFSVAWSYFSKTEDYAQTFRVSCNLCFGEKVLVASQGSTASMLNHLRHYHRGEIPNLPEEGRGKYRGKEPVILPQQHNTDAHMSSSQQQSVTNGNSSDSSMTPSLQPQHHQNGYDTHSASKSNPFSLPVVPPQRRPLVVLLDGRNCDVEMPFLKDHARLAFADAKSVDELHDVVLQEAFVCLTYGKIDLKNGALAKFKNLALLIFIAERSALRSVDLKEAKWLGISVCCVDPEDVPSVVDDRADAALSHIINLHRRNSQLHFGLATNSGRSSAESGNASALRIRGRTLGLVGFSPSAKALAIRAKAIGMNVRFYDPTVVSGEEGLFSAERDLTITDLLSKSDCLSIHRTASDTYRSTKFLDDIFTPSSLAAIKKHAFFVTVTDNSAVIDRILTVMEMGKIDGVAIDAPELSQTTLKLLRKMVGASTGVMNLCRGSNGHSAGAYDASKPHVPTIIAVQTPAKMHAEALEDMRRAIALRLRRCFEFVAQNQSQAPGGGSSGSDGAKLEQRALLKMALTQKMMNVECPVSDTEDTASSNASASNGAQSRKRKSRKRKSAAAGALSAASKINGTSTSLTTTNNNNNNDLSDYAMAAKFMKRTVEGPPSSSPGVTLTVDTRRPQSVGSASEKVTPVGGPPSDGQLTNHSDSATSGGEPTIVKPAADNGQDVDVQENEEDDVEQCAVDLSCKKSSSQIDQASEKSSTVSEDASENHMVLTTEVPAVE